MLANKNKGAVNKGTEEKKGTPIIVPQNSVMNLCTNFGHRWPCPKPNMNRHPTTTQATNNALKTPSQRNNEANAYRSVPQSKNARKSTSVSKVPQLISNSKPIGTAELARIAGGGNHGNQPNATACPHCTNIAKNLQYLEHKCFSTCKDKEKCHTCDSCRQQAQLLCKKIMSVFGGGAEYYKEKPLLDNSKGKPKCAQPTQPQGSVASGSQQQIVPKVKSKVFQLKLKKNIAQKIIRKSDSSGWQTKPKTVSKAASKALLKSTPRTTLRMVGNAAPNMSAELVPKTASKIKPKAGSKTVAKRPKANTVSYPIYKKLVKSNRTASGVSLKILKKKSKKIRQAKVTKPKSKPQPIVDLTC